MKCLHRQTWHWFLSSAVGWNVAPQELLAEAIRIRKREDGRVCSSFHLFRVPGEASSEYEIEQYSPQVPGTIYYGNMKH